jgi:hypothetical protein
MSAVTKMFASAPLSATLHKVIAKELTIQVAVVKIARLIFAVLARHVKVMVDAVVVIGNLPLTWLLVFALLLLAPMKNAVSVFATRRMLVSVVVERDLRTLMVL